MSPREGKVELTDDAAIERLVCTETVRSWRVGTDYDIMVAQDATEEDFLYVLDQLGLIGRTDFEVSYIPETGMEIYRLPMLQLPKQKWTVERLSIGVGSIVAGVIGNPGGVFDLFARHFGIF